MKLSNLRFSNILIIIFIICLISGSLSTKLEKKFKNKINNNNDHIVKHIPFIDVQPKYKVYSGYFESNKTHGRYLHYFFVESQSNPSKDPLVLWTNGGPGCAALGGYLTEHGAFLVNSDGRTVRENKYSWNKVANVLYLEQPAGVGFSYVKNERDLFNYNDYIVSDDVKNFMIHFYEKYPQFKQNDFYVSGESYGGHYVPSFALAIHEYNEKLQNKQEKINLKGWIVGNGVMDDEEDAKNTPIYMAGNSLISMKLYQEGYFACHGDFFRNQRNPKCAEKLNEMRSKTRGMNPYFIYDECSGNPFGTGKGKNDNNHDYFSNEIEKFAKKRNIHPLFALSRFEIVKPYAPLCVPLSAAQTYLNIPDVKKAFNIERDITWQICNSIIVQSYDWTRKSMIPVYKKLLETGKYKALVFTGDADLVVNSIGTQEAVYKIGYKVTKPWRSWKNSNNVVSGKVVNFENNLMFLTVSGTGHMVPTNRPLEALEMFSNFINGKAF